MAAVSMLHATDASGHADGIRCADEENQAAFTFLRAKHHKFTMWAAHFFSSGSFLALSLLKVYNTTPSISPASDLLCWLHGQLLSKFVFTVLWSSVSILSYNGVVLYADIPSFCDWYLVCTFCATWKRRSSSVSEI